MNRTKKLTQGAMLLAIVGALMLIDRQLGFLFEQFIFMAAPVVIVIYTVMYTLQDGGMLSFGMLVIGLLFGSTGAYMYIPLAIIVGMGLSIGIKKDLSRNMLLLLSMILYVIGEIIITFMILPILGIDVASQIGEMTPVFDQMGVTEGLALIVNDVGGFLVIIFIASTIIMGVLEGFFTYFVSVVLLKRLKIKDIGVSNAFDLKISPMASYILFALSMIMIFLSRFTFLQENYETLYYIIICVSFMATLVLFYYGYIFASIYGRLMLGKKSFFILILALIILFPASYFTLMIVGFLYGAGPLRTHLENKIKTVRNDEKKQ